jgi:hypothetical protein
MIKMMVSKCLMTTLAAWIQYTREEKEDRVKMERFIRKWKNQGINKCFMGWTQYIAEEKKYRAIVKRFVMRMNSGCLIRCYSAWVNMIREDKNNKRIIAKFRVRMLNMEIAKSLQSWKEHVGLRLRMKYLARRIINRCDNSKILSAWIPWTLFVRWSVEQEEHAEKMKFMTEKEQEEEMKRLAQQNEHDELKNKLQREHDEMVAKLASMKEAEAERKQKAALKMIQHMMQGCLATTLNGWKQYVKTEKYNRTVMKRFAKKMQMAAANSALAQWIDFAKERKWLRGLLNRLLGGREMLMKSAGFKAWHLNTHKHALHSKHNDELETMRQQLMEAQSFHEEHKKSAAEQQQEMQQKLLKKMIFTMQNASLGRCFTDWVLTVNYRKNCRVLINKVFGKVTNRDISAGFNQWKVFLAWENDAAHRLAIVVDKRRNALKMMADNANRMHLKLSKTKQAFVKWMLATYTVTLSGRAVKRLDNFMLMFAHAFSSAKNITSLIVVACECLQSMIAGSAGTLMILDKKSQEMFTYKSGTERRNPLHQGILGFVGKTSQSIYADMFKDERYNPAIDDVMLARGESAEAGSNSKTWWGASMPKMDPGAGSPVVLCIPVRDYDGVTIAVLAAVRVHAASEGQSVKPFNPNDALALAVLSCYVGGHIEKLNGRSGQAPGAAQVMKAMPAGFGGPNQSAEMLSPMHNERSNMSSLMKKMEVKADTMEKQSSKMQFSSKNLEKRVAAMSSYAADLESKIGIGDSRARTTSYQSYTSDAASDTSTVASRGWGRAASTIGMGVAAENPTQGQASWQQHTAALQKLFDVEKSLK